MYFFENYIDNVSREQTRVMVSKLEKFQIKLNSKEIRTLHRKASDSNEWKSLTKGKYKKRKKIIG